MKHLLDESIARGLARTLTERFGEPIGGLPDVGPQHDPEAPFGTASTCRRCGGMLGVDEDICTQCGMMGEALKKQNNVC